MKRMKIQNVRCYDAYQYKTGGIENFSIQDILKHMNKLNFKNWFHNWYL